MTKIKFTSAEDFLVYGQEVYRGVAKTCQRFFNGMGSWNFSASKAKSEKICNASLNMFSKKTSHLIDELASGGEETRNNLYSDGFANKEKMVVTLQNMYLYSVMSDSLCSANAQSPYPKLELQFCPTLNTTEIERCQEEMVAYQDSLLDITNGYVGFSDGQAIKPSNLALFFVFAHIMNQVFNTVVAPWTRSQKAEQTENRLRM